MTVVAIVVVCKNYESPVSLANHLKLCYYIIAKREREKGRKMKQVVVVTVNGKTSSVSEFASKKAAESELKDVWGWEKRNLSRTTYTGTIRNQYGCPQNATAMVFSAKEWETFKYAY